MPESAETIAFVQESTCSERIVVLRARIVGGDVPARTLYVIVASAGEQAVGVGLVDPEHRRATWGGRLPPGAQRQRPREAALENARVVAVDEDGVYIDKEGSLRVIKPHGGRVVVTDAPSPSPPTSARSLLDLEEAALAARGRALVEAIARAALDGHRAEVRRVLERAEERIHRRQAAIRGDLAKIDQADAIAAQAQWFVGEAARAPRGATKLVVTDWSTGEARPLEIPLDPARSAKEQVEAMFKRAKRLRLGARIASERLAQSDTQAAAIAACTTRIAEAADLGALEAILRDAKRAAPRDVAYTPSQAGAGAVTAKPRGRAGPRVPYRAFHARSGRRLLVGKGAADNDALTLHVARPHDLWLHAKDRTGAHVIVVLDKGQTCPAEDLVDAAHLAAHFSEAREETVVDVQYTDRRYLRKPRRSPPGFVIVEREKVLVLRVEPDLLRALLEREEL